MNLTDKNIVLVFSYAEKQDPKWMKRNSEAIYTLNTIKQSVPTASFLNETIEENNLSWFIKYFEEIRDVVETCINNFGFPYFYSWYIILPKFDLKWYPFEENITIEKGFELIESKIVLA